MNADLSEEFGISDDRHQCLRKMAGNLHVLIVMRDCPRDLWSQDPQDANHLFSLLTKFTHQP